MIRPKRWPLLALLLCTAACRKATHLPERPSAQDSYRQPERLIAALGLHAGDTVADLGAGGGYLTLHLAAAVGAGGHVVATDIDESALAALRERTRQLPQVEARRVSAAEPGLEAGRFDLVLLAQLDQLLADRVSYLRLLRPALRPGGRVAISNREDRLAAARAAAEEAGYHAEVIPASLPAQFVMILRP